MIVIGHESGTFDRWVAGERKQLVQFAGLKPDGFVLKTAELDGRSAVLAGGNEEAATMYAAYGLLERLGIVFQLTGDIIPQEKPDLALPALDERLEPHWKYRGMHCCHGLRWQELCWRAGPWAAMARPG